MAPLRLLHAPASDLSENSARADTSLRSEFVHMWDVGRGRDPYGSEHVTMCVQALASEGTASWASLDNR